MEPKKGRIIGNERPINHCFLVGEIVTILRHDGTNFNCVGPYGTFRHLVQQTVSPGDLQILNPRKIVNDF